MTGNYIIILIKSYHRKTTMFFHTDTYNAGNVPLIFYGTLLHIVNEHFNERVSLRNSVNVLDSHMKHE